MLMSTRSLAFSLATLLCAGVVGAQQTHTESSIALDSQQTNALPAFAFGPQTINSNSGETVTLDFGLTPLVHGPYTLTIQNINSQGAIFMLNGTQILNPVDLMYPKISTPVMLGTANTLEVTFIGGRRDSQLIVSISGWEYAYASAYPSGSVNTAEPEDVDWRGRVRLHR